MFVTNAANHCYDSLLALVYPQGCTLCGGSVESRSLGPACASCWEQTRVFSGAETICWKCGQVSPGIVAPEQREQVRCHRCDDKDFTAARACGPYGGALRASVLSLKHQPHASARLLELLVRAQTRYPLSRATIVVPVPLHPERELARGFNQAALLGRELSLATSLPFDDASLVRAHHTSRHRAGLDAKGRRETVENAFVVRYPALIAGERALLVDDVFTTGATVSACARVLLEAGATEIYVLTIARPTYN